MDFGISGRKALIVGGSKGLGRGVARALAAEGVDVALIARDAEPLAQTASTIESEFGVRALAVPADLGDAASLDAALARCASSLGEIDILLNNSGGPPPSGVAGIAPAVWEAQFQSMVMPIFRITQFVLPAMRRRGFGRILTVASSSVVEPNPAIAISNTLRSALVGWSKTLATEVAADGITVNLLLPGQVATDRTAFLDAAAAERQGVPVEKVRGAREAGIPARRYGTPEEFGAVAAFLASVQAAYVTGSMVRVDGGLLRSV
ncbi:SDR family oxidoreductase [Tahibacter amnicola]|uniref:SDR family oxidoreductase n=1 Tax=Tahibacter amnicola TaxID=2976241 RepID=A0ABY6BN27_9GAMM|nr:SDR family oxidoreductase [Tahibacter amnicola]UXI69971.1 SDR family oxidoreductase [Tahibacter amnicola]